MSKLIPALSIKNFNFYYNSRKILEGVSMNISQNKITAMIGPSGCGKSTFLKSLNRMSELEGEVKLEGTVEFFGQNIHGKRVNLNRLRRQISIIYGIPNLFPMSIYDNVVYGVKLIGWRPKAELDEIVEIALKRANIWEELKNKLHKSALELSIGQQQRLCIARSLAVKPQVLLIDEFCLGLDAIAIKKMEELIECLRSELTIVFVSHNIQQVLRLSDFTAIFQYNQNHVGNLADFGPSKRIIANSFHYRTRDSIGSYWR
jgi:phosphate transport system ATP-binding protein